MKYPIYQRFLCIILLAVFGCLYVCPMMNMPAWGQVAEAGVRQPDPARAVGKTTEALRIERLNRPKVFTDIIYNERNQQLDVCMPAETNTAQMRVELPNRVAAPNASSVKNPIKSSLKNNASVKSLMTAKPSPKSPEAKIYPHKNVKKTAVIFIHGGNFKSGTKEQMLPYCKLFAQAGFLSVTVNYRLSPAYAYPAAIDDIQDAVVWVQSQAYRYGFDPKHVVLVGYSAGGNLALMTSSRINSDKFNEKFADKKINQIPEKADTAKSNPPDSKKASTEKSSTVSKPLPNIKPVQKPVQKLPVKKSVSSVKKTSAKKNSVVVKQPIKKNLSATGVKQKPQLKSVSQSQNAIKSNAVKTQPYPKPDKIYPIAGVIDLAAPTHFDTLIASTPQLQPDIQRYLSNENPKTASPVYAAHQKLPPVLIIHGQQDALIPMAQSRELMTTLQELKVPVRLLAYPGVGHNLIIPNAQLSKILRDMTAFLIYIENRPMR